MFDIQENLLSWVIFLPIAGIGILLALEAVGRIFMSRRLSDRSWRAAGMGFALGNFGLSLLVWQRFDPTDGGLQLVEYSAWLPDLGVQYYVGVDGISLFLVVMTGFLLPITLLASWTDIASRVKQYVFFMLCLQTGMMGAFLSMNLFLFYLFWELMLIPMYFIIGIWGGPRKLYATMKFFIYTMVGSLLMLVGLLVVYYLNAQQFGFLNFDYIGHGGASGIIDTVIPTAGAPWWQTQFWLFLVFGLAFAVKVPMFPFHTWLPDAHVEAPTPGSAILAGVLLKLGTYGFIRFAMPLFPEAAVELSGLVFALGVTGIIYGALVAMIQQDIKKLVAYSSVSHLGFVMIGLFAMNLQGLEGAILQMVNHGVSTGALFILVGMIYERRHVREISEFGGLAKVMPVFATFFLIATLSSIGLPMLNGFVGEFLILLGTFAAAPWVAVLATTGVILSAIYMLWMYRRVFFGPVTNNANRGLLDLDLRERIVAVALTLPMFWIGIYPASFLRPMDAAVSELMRTMEQRGANIAAHNGGQSALASLPAETSERVSWLRDKDHASEAAE